MSEQQHVDLWLHAAGALPAEVGEDAIAEAAYTAAYTAIAQGLEAAGYPVTGDVMPYEDSLLRRAFELMVRSMALNNPAIAELQDEEPELLGPITTAERTHARLTGGAVLVEGARVRLRNDVDRYPHFIAPAGALGTVREYTGGMLFVKLDEKVEGAEEWDNELIYSEVDEEEPWLDLECIDDERIDVREYTVEPSGALTPKEEA